MGSNPRSSGQCYAAGHLWKPPLYPAEKSITDVFSLPHNNTWRNDWQSAQTISKRCNDVPLFYWAQVPWFGCPTSSRNYLRLWYILRNTSHGYGMNFVSAFVSIVKQIWQHHLLQMAKYCRTSRSTRRSLTSWRLFSSSLLTHQWWKNTECVLLLRDWRCQRLSRYFSQS